MASSSSTQDAPGLPLIPEFVGFRMFVVRLSSLVLYWWSRSGQQWLFSTRWAAREGNVLEHIHAAHACACGRVCSACTPFLRAPPCHGQVSDSEVVVRNTALKWTMAWGFFCTVLFIPAIYCLVESQNKTAQGGEIVPVWIGVVLLLFALLSCCMLLPFTVVSTTHMDKRSDLFVQHHGLLNCFPYSCIPSTEFPLSEIERIDVEDFDGPEFHDIGDASSDSSSEDDQDMDEAERRQDEADRRHFKFKQIKPRSQVVVHTKYDSVPITAVTSGLPSVVPFREKRMTAHEIKRALDRFLGFASAEEQADDEMEAGDTGGNINLSSGQWEPASPIPEGGYALEAIHAPSAASGALGSAVHDASGPASQPPRHQGGHSRSETAAATAGRSPARSGTREEGGAGVGGTRAGSTERSTAALSAGWGEQVDGAAGTGASELEVDDRMLEFVNIPPHMRPVRTTGPKLVTNPIGRPVPAEVEERATRHQDRQPKPSPADGPFGPASKMEVESAASARLPFGAQQGASDAVEAIGSESWARLPVQPWEDETGLGRKYPAKKKDETDEERKMRRALKKVARKSETAEEKAARKATKAAKKLRKAQRKQPGARRGSAVPGGVGSAGDPQTESHMDGASDGDGGSGDSSD